MKKEPKDRYPDGTALNEALKAIAEEMKSYQGSPNAKRNSVRMSSNVPAVNNPQNPMSMEINPGERMDIEHGGGLSTTNKILIGILVLLIVIVVFALLQMMD